MNNCCEMLTIITTKMENIGTKKNMNELIEFDIQKSVFETSSGIEIDISNMSFINEIWTVVGASEIVIKSSVFLPVVFWGIFANIALLYIILTNPHLRSPTNLIIGNMAAADLASLLLHPWIFLVYNFFQNYQLGVFGCKIEGAFECSLLLCSVMNIIAISYDRLTAIVLPKETRLNRKGAKIVMAVTWIGGLILATPLLIYRTYKERQWLDFREKYCTENTLVINIYWHVIITMMVWIPLIIMLICYVAIYIKLNRYEKSIAKHANPIHVSYKKKVVKSMFIVVITFMLCRLPFTGLIFYRNHLLKMHVLSKNNAILNQVNGTYQTLWFISKYLIFVNAAVNPMIYGLTNEKFLRVVKQMKITRWFFKFDDNSHPTGAFVVVDKHHKNKQTKETIIDSNNRNRLFTIFKSKYSAGNKNKSFNHPITDDVKVCT